MKPQTASRLAWWLWAAGPVLLAGTIAFSLVTDIFTSEGVFIVVVPLFVLAFATVGALVASRHPQNSIGWILLVTAVAWSAAGAADSYAIYAHARGTTASMAARLADWVNLWFYGPAIFVPITLVLLLFPTGRPPSHRWRPIMWLTAAANLGLTFAAAFDFDPDTTAADVRFLRENPFGIEAIDGLLDVVAGVSLAGASAALITSLLAMGMRFRRSSGDERAQLTWLTYAGVVVVVTLVGVFGAGAGGAFETGSTAEALTQALILAALTLLPLAAGLAILKHRLYDIDVVIRKTLVYGALAGFITGVYVVIVVLIGALTTDALVPSIVATTIVAAAFQPVRERVIRVANRLVFGKRAAPYEVLARFSDRVGAAYAVDDVMERAARVIAEGTGAEGAEVWVRVAGDLQRAASWPLDDGDERGAGREQTVPVVHQGEDLGEIRIRTSPAHPLRPTEEKLLRDLAAQTGSVLRNMGLTSELEARIQELSRRAEELRSSRSRIVQAHDAERRRLERNIHDGAQQHLVALAVKLRLAGSVAAKDPERAETMLRELHDQTDAALRTLLDLASGIYPAVLEEQGIGPALERQAGGVGAVVGIEAEGLGRLPIETEAAVYFVCLEAMQNAAKYARASRVLVHLAKDDGLLMFSVVDDGVGFDAETARTGSGLQNMRDRLTSFGGEVHVDSTPGQGTTVSGRVPIRQEATV